MRERDNKIHTIMYIVIYLSLKGTVQRALCMHVISVYFHLNLCKLYDGPIRLLVDHDFTLDVFKLNR